MTTVSMTVNGKTVTRDIDPRTLLAEFLRENLRLTGTHIGCDTTQCGCCTVHVDGKAMKSCTLLAAIRLMFSRYQCSTWDRIRVVQLGQDGQKDNLGPRCSPPV
jgi:aerobic-type carbon monoxide dehydrogenase small subunit (CoxS/CutS family)